jgi:hypothetical protein
MTEVTRAPNIVDAVEALVLAQPQLSYGLVHRFAHGMYAREITIPAHAILTGERHLQGHLNIISKGRILVYTEGEPVREIIAPFTFIAEAGTRRVGRTLEETVWTTIHATDAVTVDEAERELVAPNDNPLIERVAPPTLLQESPCPL